MATRMTYKGRQIVIEPHADHAHVTIDGNAFRFQQHPGPLPMWACPNAYFMAPELKAVIRHLIDYWYIVTSPSTAPPLEEDGHGGHATAVLAPEADSAGGQEIVGVFGGRHRPPGAPPPSEQPPMHGEPMHGGEEEEGEGEGDEGGPAPRRRTRRPRGS